MIDKGQVVVRAVEPAGVASGLTTLIQLVAATPPARAGEICVPGARSLDAPRFAWRVCRSTWPARSSPPWLDPELLATFELIEQVLAGVAAILPGSYLRIGEDKPRGMPHHLYAAYIERVRRLVRSLGRRPLGWQESARAGLNPDDIIQYWLTDMTGPSCCCLA